MHRKNEDAAYRIYVTDALKLITENTMRQSGGAYIEKRYIDLIDPKPVDTRTGDEIADDVIARCGLVVVK